MAKLAGCKTHVCEQMEESAAVAPDTSADVASVAAVRCLAVSFERKPHWLGRRRHGGCCVRTVLGVQRQGHGCWDGRDDPAATEEQKRPSSQAFATASVAFAGADGRSCTDRHRNTGVGAPRSSALVISGRRIRPSRRMTPEIGLIC